LKKKIDYEEIGLKVGLEFHQMLDTKHKLFCSCPTIILPPEEKEDYVFKRKLRPVASELGEVDPAALFEFKRKRVYEYHHLDEASCLVEADEEPPHDLNREALTTALIVALMLNSHPVDEVQVMRKTVIDGSNTTGFQRTALIALGGWVEIDGKKIPIQTICLEEDAARKIVESDKTVVYRLDRLGIPLIEIATAPTISSPEEAEKTALRIGQILRLTGRVKRGIGTIRQDINISIKNGAKIEVKGVQKLGLIRKVVAYEVQRQLALLEIKEILHKRKISEDDLKQTPLDVTEVFRNTKSKIIRRTLKKGGKVIAIKLPGFKGILGREIQPGRRFGTELADRAKYWSGVGGILHSDELPNYGISEKEVEAVSKILNLGPQDGFVIVADAEEKALNAINAVVERCIEALRGVPEETRGPNPDGTTHFSRPRPGAARMYPETDIRPKRITPEYLENVKKLLPEPLSSKLSKFIKKYGLSRDLAEKMISSYRLDLFEKLVEKYPHVSPTLVASTLENTLKSLRRENVPVDELEDETFEELFSLLDSGTIVKESIPEILRYVALNPGKRVIDAVNELSLRALPLEEVERIIDKIVKDKIDVIRARKEGALGPLMGIAMRTLRGKADGGLVNKLLREKVKKILKGN